MTLDQFIQIGQTVGALLLGVGTIGTWIATRNNSRKIDVIHTATNSMKDALIASTAIAFEAKGHAAGLEQGRSENQEPV